MGKRSQHTKDGGGDAFEDRKRKLASILEETDSKECLTPSKRVTRSSTMTPLKQVVEAKKDDDYYSMFNREKYRREKKSTTTRIATLNIMWYKQMTRICIKRVPPKR